MAVPNSARYVIKTSHPNPSLQVTADNQIKMVEAPVEKPGPGHVLLHIKTTGICGSDIHFWKTGRIGSLVVEGDCILGHEAAGVVLECGEGVTDLSVGMWLRDKEEKRTMYIFHPRTMLTEFHTFVGDRVAVEPGVPCEKCFLCREGRYNLCDDVQFAGVYPYHGTLQRYKVHPAKWLYKIPENVSYAEAALLEPLSVVLHGVKTGGLSLGRPALICGAGPIGLLALAAARASGAHPIVITDLEPKRLAFAQDYVPSCIAYQVDRSISSEENAAAVRKLFGVDEYSAPQTVLECTGVESSVVLATFAVRRGGVVCVIGVGKSVMNNLPFMHISLAEIDLRFINRYRDTWPAGLACLSGGILDVKKLVSHTFPLEQAMEAMNICSDLSNGSIKVQIVDEVEASIFAE
ncbi:canditate alcohol dehydrogenase [Apiospora kogelbergensis]|uniref:L-arabinitol 4-dehydrogenase n=1 Tax=Apiospora kogelbergensis TaxID=1337665 RepID=A0AAW0QGE7_9PEZI